MPAALHGGFLRVDGYGVWVALGGSEGQVGSADESYVGGWKQQRNQEAARPPPFG